MDDRAKNDLSCITLLERSLKEIVNLAEKHPENVPVQQARILAEVALMAPADERIANGVDDQARAVLALQGVVGKRLTYRSTDGRTQGAQA